MSTSENISLWKKRAEIDYIPLFISLWLSLNAWMRDRYTVARERKREREMLELLKRGGNTLSDRFAELIHAKDSNGSRFRGNFGELQRALVNANIPYDRSQNKTVSFVYCIIEWNNGQPEFVSVLKTKYQKTKIKIDNDLWVEDNTGHLFAAYMEIVYQIRCTLFHGNLAPTPKNERVIRQLYLTLSMIMEKI